MKHKPIDATKLLQAKALEYVSDGVMILDPQGHVVYADPSMERMLGLAAADMRAHPDRIGHRLNFRSGLALNDVLAELDEKAAWTGEATCLSADEHAVLLDVTAQRLENSEGESMGAILVARDVTRERTLETQVVQSQQMELVENLSIGIAHEFRNLLTVMLAYATLLKDETKGQACQQDAGNLMETIERANDLTKRLLAITRRASPRIEPVDVQKVIDDVVAVLQKSMPREIELGAPHDASVPPISADAAILYRALLNLCLNACEAMPKGGRISIEVDTVKVEQEDMDNWPDRLPGEYVTMAVTDTGEGMSMEVRKRIFEPFFTTKQHGTGLGLSVVQHSLASMGGWITVYSEPNLGSCFRLYIPVCKAAGRPAAVEDTTLVEGAGTILAVDDDPLALNVARRCLEKAGYTVLSASSGEKAVATYRQHGQDIDLVLLDVVMPYMNGEEVYREIAKIRPDVKVLAVSGFTPKSAERLLQVPHIRFLGKPYTRGQLCREVRRMIGGVE
ncbi:MAG: response regulator [Kiritimatiellae bacterium]|nr:response regulator [Kiritimatiellia bacterium]